jgi:hypothetical protein
MGVFSFSSLPVGEGGVNVFFCGGQCVVIVVLLSFDSDNGVDPSSLSITLVGAVVG